MWPRETSTRPAAHISASPASAPDSARRARRRWRTATCWWSCPPARASRSATSCRRCMRDDLTIVVSPLVALMQDQVEALHARGLGDAVALVNAQQDAGTNAGRHASARPAGSCGCCTWRPSASPRRGSSSACARSHRAVRGRRGPLRLAVGARLPARLLPPGRRRPPPGRPGHRGLHGHGHAAGGASTSSAGSACASRCRWPPASTAPTSRSRWPVRRRTRSGR